ncbi:MAG: TspO/MBR family protein [Hyphomicrobiaceae bacterium]|nr:tryptophan-rich sensory protein [Hyphomicrobiaceae bacterium]
MSQFRRYSALAVFVGIVAVAAVFGSRYMPGLWYASLNKPAWTPPNWLFGPVWTILYMMIAVAGWRVWRAGGVSLALGIWLFNVAANGLWSYLMFGQHNIGLALADISVVWLSIVAFIVLARPIDRWASLLFVPYLVWVTYASALNVALWSLN